MVYQTPRLTLLSLLTAVFLLGFAPVSALDFTWPANTVQCGIIPMNITGGSPPYTFNILPVDGQVFSWNLLEPISGKWINETWNVQLQLAAGTAYVAYLSHSGNVGQGGITPIQVVGSSSDPLCLSTAASNYTSNLFSMSLTGLPSPTECDTSLRIGHDGSSASAPYNYTIVPLDGGYKPWTAAFPDGQSSVDVNVNMTAGSRFTVFLSNKLYWGGAQSGKIYTVNNSTSGSITCEAQPYAPPMGYSWPASLLSTTLPIADDYAPTGSPGNSTTSSSTSTSGTAIPSDNSNNSPKPSGLSTGAMAGIGAGIGCLALAGIGAFIWWLLRRRRVRHSRKGDQRGYEAAGEKSSRFDMLSPPKHAHTDSFGPHKDGAGGEEGDEPRVEPFRSHSDYARASLPVQAYAAGLALPIPGPGGLGSVGAGGLSSPNQIGSSEAGQTDYNTVETVQHAAFPVPMPMTPPTDSNAAVGRELDAMSDTGSDGLSRGPTGTAFYYIPPAGASGSAVDIARSASHTLYNDQGQGQGQGIGQGPLQGLLPPGSMIRGPVSAAAEKARLSAQYAQMDSNGVPNAAPPSSSSPFASPSTPAAPIGLQQQAHLAASASQIDLPAPQHVAHPAQNQVSVISPSSAAVESHQGHIHAQQQNNGGGEGAIYRRHMDGGEMQDENRPDVGEVELPPLYEDVPARRV